VLFVWIEHFAKLEILAGFRLHYDSGQPEDELSTPSVYPAFPPK
jgi:hypothetical protein